MESVSTDPEKVKTQLVNITRIMPFISGNNFSAVVKAECHKKGVGVVRPSGAGFIVELSGKAPSPTRVYTK